MNIKLKSPIDAPFTPLAWDKFGVVRPLNIDPSGVRHNGVDLRPHENGGTRNVYAIADGVIVVSRGDQGSYYSVDHGQGVFSLYVHINRTLPVGTKVRQGDVIATYLPSYNHLHFMLRQGGNTEANNLDPEKYIKFNQTNQDTMYEEVKNEAEKMWNGDMPYQNAQTYINKTWVKVLENEIKEQEKQSINLSKELDVLYGASSAQRQEAIKVGLQSKFRPVVLAAIRMGETEQDKADIIKELDDLKKQLENK